jgi:hypothetical protein
LVGDTVCADAIAEAAAKIKPKPITRPITFFTGKSLRICKQWLNYILEISGM